MYIRTSVPDSSNENRQENTNIFIGKKKNHNKPNQFILRNTNKKKVTDLGKEKKKKCMKI